MTINANRFDPEIDILSIKLNARMPISMWMKRLSITF